MQFIDVFALYWLGMKILLIGTSIAILISSIDDFHIDLHFWFRNLYRALFIRPRHPRMKVEKLYEKEQQPIALMSPAWDEASVIGKMVERCIQEYDYDNFYIFVGTYPNDPATQAEVDKVAEKYPNVFKVVGKRPGPTTKAECLNNVIETIYEFEKEMGFKFQCFAYHDAEDVIHPLEMRLYNWLIPRKDLLQIPVRALPRRWYDFIGNHYMDEFAEYNEKDLSVRESFCGSVPSAGVATAFSRKAFLALAEMNNGQIFDETSLTEDYNIGYFLYKAGLKAVFVRFPVIYDNENAHRFGHLDPIIASGGIYPNHFFQSFRQKARWSTGIIFQGWKMIGWPKDWRMVRMLIHDRKGIFSNFVPVLGYFVLINVIIMEIYTHVVYDAWWFPGFIPYKSFTWYLLWVNGFFFLNRLAHRLFFTTKLYGIKHGILSLPRMVISNLVNFAAMVRAIWLIWKAKKEGTSLKWDKTDHSEEAELL